MNWRAFAYTFNAFEHWGSMVNCAAVARAVAADIGAGRALADVPVEALQTALFMAARAEHRSRAWVEHTPVEDAVFAELVRRQGETWIAAQLDPPEGARARTRRGRRPPACPACGSAGPVRILYGEPTPEAGARAERGEIWIGGCCFDGDGTDPAWKCLECGKEFSPPRRPGKPRV
ncbi:MAG: hypothetical protein HY908_09130 [Myxococcales bacterium]|nr:hypothetical protein [Myxococcales bacterium]